MRQYKPHNDEKYIKARKERKRRVRLMACLAAVVVLCTAYALVRPALTQELRCAIPEHTHTDDCYTPVSDGESAAPGDSGETPDIHLHSPDCYDGGGNLSCGMVQLSGSQDGGDAPAGAESDGSAPLTCSITDEEHVHGPRCYGTWVLTCGMEEHVHTGECYYSAGDEEEPAGGEDSQSLMSGALDISLLYGDEQPQEKHPDGVSYYTHGSMSGYIMLEPDNLDADLTDVTVTLSFPKQYVEKDTISIPPFSTNSSATEYEILPVEEDEDNYSISILFSIYDKTQTLVLPFTLSFLDDVVPDNYELPVTASVSCDSFSSETSPSIYKPIYNEWAIEKFVNSNRMAAFSRDGAEVVVTPLDENGNPYLDDATYVKFAFIVNNYTNPNCNLSDLRDACEVTLTDTLPEYTDLNGESHIAVFDPDMNPGWELSGDGLTVSKTYYGKNSDEVLIQIYNDELQLRFPGLVFTAQDDGVLTADLDNSISLTAVPSGEAKGETRPTAEDPLRFRLTNDPGTSGTFTKAAMKGNIYDVDIYKTNPYPWGLSLKNDKVQPLRHLVIQDRKIVEDGDVKVSGLDEALKFVSLESNAISSVLPDGKTYADIIEKVTAYYADSTVEDIPVTQADASGNISVSFDEDRVCEGYDIVFCDDYEMQFGENVGFTVYTVYRDPENTHVPSGEEKVTYTNTARSVNSYPVGDEMKYAYMYASHRYDMLPSVEKLSVNKLTLCNNETDKLWGGGGNKVGDVYFYLIQLSGVLLEPGEKEYGDIQVVDLLPEGVTYDKIYLIQQANAVPSILEGGTSYQPDIIENYHNSGRTAVIFHLNGENLQKALKTPPTDIYFGVRINQDARSGTIRNYVYVAGEDLDEYQGATGGTQDIYDLNNNGRTDDQIAYSYSDAVVVAAQSVYAEKFIAPAGSENWSSQGLSLTAGSEFDYLLSITNETAAEYTGLTVYDVLPRIGDKNIFLTLDRGSEFQVQLREAITPPDGYTVFYTTSMDVYNNSMHDMENAGIWTEEVSDYSAVTAFKLVAGEGTVMAGRSVFKVRIPARIPSSFDEASLELLDGKAGQDAASGTVSYLEAVNSFGFRADQLSLEKDSNTVWVRVPFAGFQLKKTDAASGEGLAGAEFTLTDENGSEVYRALSDAQGLIQFRKLTEGTYTLTETKAPDGYADKHISITVTIVRNPVTMEYTVSFSGGYAGAGTLEDPLCIGNITAYRLPETGGSGVRVFYALGAALLVSAAALSAVRRRLRTKG